MNRRKIISVSIGIAICGILAGIIFSFIKNGESTMGADMTAEVNDDSRSIASRISKQISAAERILDLQGKTAKEKAMALYDTYATSSLSIVEKNFSIEVQLADTVDLHTLGLSGRDGLSKKNGLLFIFKRDDYYPFWMKDMSFAIDIVWLNADKKIVHIESGVKPDTYPKTFSSPELARYVLEVAGGVVKEYKLENGDTVVF